MIRNYEEKDRAVLDNLMTALQAHFAKIDHTKESQEFENSEAAHKYMDKMLQDAQDMNGVVFVCEEDNEVVGFVQGVIIDRDGSDDDVIFYTTHKAQKQGWIGLLFVKPEHRGKGYGKVLLAKIEEYFKSQNCDTVRLLTMTDNVDTLKIYEKNGFSSHDVEMVKALK